MMANLFSVFDPSTSWGYPLNWFSSLLGLFFLPYLYWMLPNRFTLLWSQLFLVLHRELGLILGKGNLKGSLIFITLFTFVLFNNFLGLVPYVFTSTSHLVVTLAFALPLWLGFMIYGWFNHTLHMLAHLVPQGTPPVLMPFMVCIETISNLIRPGTLAVRLAANMIAGHLLLTLLGNQGPGLSSLLLSLLVVTQILLLTLESAVAVIQSYVFAVLSTLYCSEVN
uniref:ATP synthase F0 subunit 6 n=1 Tax=Leptestheria dahalacensis TaxID=202083 RepID=UPI0022A6E821|nr:ATP synthase F0 subunit 6 [Leptestheria dahalacensis]UNY33476.1 ATP synthase F0 subunit 6 [Leptestheria dahalacensis]